MTWWAAAAAVGAALALEGLLAEFPGRVHPVALFGRVAGAVESAVAGGRHPRATGVLVAAALPLGAALLVWGLARAAAAVTPLLGAAVAAGVLFSATSLRMLVAVAGDVVERAETDPAGAREAARALVGRDTAALSGGELRSAAVESAAENLADGLVGPLLAFVLGAQVSLAVGAAAAAWVKAVNTLDSMLGYRSKPVGWASARLDDLVMWVPARLSAALVAAAARDPSVPSRARAWARDPPSPNSGWPMAAVAVALDVRLLKPGVYDLNPPAALPTAAEARRGVRVVAVAGLLAYLVALLAAAAVPGGCPWC